MSQNTLKVHDLNEDAEFDENGIEVFDEKALVSIFQTDCFATFSDKDMFW